MRKALVSDVVRSYIYVLRQRKTAWPMPILGQPVPPYTQAPISSEDLGAFVSVAFSIQPNYIVANRAIILMATWLRNFSATETAYALYILRKYYGRTEQTQDDQSHFC